MKYKKGFKYVLEENESFIFFGKELDSVLTDFCRLESVPGVNMVRLTVLAGFPWDGPSGPTVDDKTNLTPSLFHDCMYRLIRERLISRDWYKIADMYFWVLLRRRDMYWVRARYYYLAVKNFGRFVNKSKKVLYAP